MTKLTYMTAASLLAIICSPAVAQDSGQQAGGDADSSEEEIVITGRFFDEGSKSAMKMDVSVMDTPFSVSAYSDDFVQSLETTTVEDLYRYMTGVKKAGNTGYDLTLRGFETGGDDKNAIMVDGLPGLSTRFSSPPTIGVERIELVKGPMSVLYGQMQPGGFVNLVSKKPEAQFSGMVELRADTWAGAGIDPFKRNGYTGAVDVTGPVDENGTLLYRFVAEYGDRDTFRDFTYDRGLYLAPSLTWNIGADTALTGQFEYRDGKSSFDNGLVAPDRDVSLVAPITTRYQEPDNFRKEEGTTGVLRLVHRFDNGWNWTTAFRTVDYKSSQQEFSNRPVRPNGLTLQRRARELETKRHYDYVDSNIVMDFGTGGIEHKLLVGVNAGRDTVQENRIKFVNGGACPGPLCFDIAVYNPVYGQVPDFDDLPAINPSRPQDINSLTNQLFTTETLGFYISDLISFGDHWKLSIANRAFRDKTTIEELRLPDVPKQTKKASKLFLPSVGLLFQPNDFWTLYGSYSESYVPADPSDFNEFGENPFDPVQGKQIEVGAKADSLLDGLLTGSVALFRIDQVNLLNSFDCDLGVCYETVGKVRSEGVEIEANLTPLPNWQIITGYAYVDARVLNSTDPIEEGSQLANTAKHAGHIWSRYDFDNGLGIGLGVSHTGKRPGKLRTSNTNYTLTLPAYTVVDLGVYYTHANHQVSLKVNNLFDERYYASAGFTAEIQIAPGAPRNAVLSYRLGF